MGKEDIWAGSGVDVHVRPGLFTQRHPDVQPKGISKSLLALDNVIKALADPRDKDVST